MSKLTGVYELLDAHAFGAALKMCDTALKKKADDDMFRAIRALCFLHLGRREEALAACEEIAGGKNLFSMKQAMLPQVINTLQMIYVRLGKLDRIIEIIEAASKGSVDETLWQNLFHALTLRGEWGRMQQVAMKLCAKFPRQSRYFEWVVVCMLMQGGPVRALAPRMLTKCTTLAEEPVDALSITGGSAEVGHRIFTERKILEADALMDGDPESAIKALKHGVKVGDRRFMVAALHAKMGNMDQCMAELAPFDGFDKVCGALDAGCDAHAIAEACSEHPRVWLQLRAYQQDAEAVNEYMRTYGHEADAFFHIRPFLRTAHAQSLPSLDDQSLEGTHLLNVARAHYAVWQLSRSSAAAQDTSCGGKHSAGGAHGLGDDLHFPPSLEHRVTLGGGSPSNADVIRLYRAALCGEKEQYDEALGILEHQSEGEKDVRRSEALKLLLHGWKHDGQAVVDIWDKLEMKNVLYTSRFTALVLQWCLECKQLDKLNKIAIRTRAHLSESIRECTDSIQSCFERGPMHCIPQLYAYNRDQMCNLAHANADTILALLHVHNRPDDLAMLEEIETLDREIHDTDCGGLLQELCAPTGFLPHAQTRTYDLPPENIQNVCEQVKVHALMRPDLIHTVKRRRDELKFLRELHRRAAGITTTTITTTTTTTSSSATLKNNDDAGVSALTNSTQRPSFDAALALLEEDYERVSVIFTQLLGTTPKENVEQQNGNGNENNENNERSNTLISENESLSQALDLCVLIWAAKMLPKSKKRSSPLFASRTALKSALHHFSKDFPRQCLKDLAFKP